MKRFYLLTIMSFMLNLATSCDAFRDSECGAEDSFYVTNSVADKVFVIKCYCGGHYYTYVEDSMVETTDSMTLWIDTVMDKKLMSKRDTTNYRKYPYDKCGGFAGATHSIHIYNMSDTTSFKFRLWYDTPDTDFISNAHRYDYGSWYSHWYVDYHFIISDMLLTRMEHDSTMLTRFADYYSRFNR